MKKLGLLLFIVCLIGVGITGNKCARKPDPVTPIDTSTQTTTKKDTSGETLYVTCTDGITVNAKPIPNAVVYLVNNYDDWTNWTVNGVAPPKSSFRRVLVSGSTGMCEFDTIRPPSESVKHTNYPGHTGGYIYYMTGFKIVGGVTDSIMSDRAKAYNNNTLDGPLTVNINNNKQFPHDVTLVFP